MCRVWWWWEGGGGDGGGVVVVVECVVATVFCQMPDGTGHPANLWSTFTAVGAGGRTGGCVHVHACARMRVRLVNLFLSFFLWLFVSLVVRCLFVCLVVCLFAWMCVCVCVCLLVFFFFVCSVVFMQFFSVYALLYESPGGNQVDGLPPAEHTAAVVDGLK